MDEKRLTHIDLFSGIGGFTLAAECAGFKTVVFCEKEKFCQKVLKKHWPEVPIISDIQDIVEEKKPWREFVQNANKGKLSQKLEIKIDLLTAGVPCQPASIAGKRGGKTDARWLWPETLEAIRLIMPAWCLLENVCGFLSLEGGLEFEQVCLDLENQGYEVQSFIIPACGLNAPHRRNRVWIVAHCKSGGIQGRSISIRSSQSRQATCNIERSRKDASDSKAGRSRRHEFESIKEGSTSRSVWQENWHEIAARFCRVDDGVPDRVHRLKALGNAIVPQIAYEILKNIAWIENENN